MRSNLTIFEAKLKEKNLDGFIVTNPTNIFYLTGFSGIAPQEREAILVLRSKYSAVLIVPRLYQKEAFSLKKINTRLQIKVVEERNELFETAKKLISPFSQARLVPSRQAGLDDEYKIGFEEDDLKFGEYKELLRKFSINSNNNQRTRLVPFKNLIEDLRVIKTAEELKKIKKAQLISQLAYEAIIKTIKVGQTEQEIAQTLQQIIRSLGGQGLAFESIIASGPNSGIPHHRTGSRKLAMGDILLFDFGAKYQDYCGDLSRTVFIGKTTDVQKNIYIHVQKSQQKAINLITHGLKASEAYHAASSHFQKHNLDKYFLHSLGHGIGLEVHEKPYLRPTHTQARLVPSRQAGAEDEELKENMVFSVEPGLYLPWGGVRIEDLVVIQNGRAKVLGKLYQKIIEI